MSLNSANFIQKVLYNRYQKASFLENPTETELHSQLFPNRFKVDESVPLNLVQYFLKGLDSFYFYYKPYLPVDISKIYIHFANYNECIITYERTPDVEATITISPICYSVNALYHEAGHQLTNSTIKYLKENSRILQKYIKKVGKPKFVPFMDPDQHFNLRQKGMAINEAFADFLSCHFSNTPLLEGVIYNEKSYALRNIRDILAYVEDCFNEAKKFKKTMESRCNVFLPRLREDFYFMSMFISHLLWQIREFLFVKTGTHEILNKNLILIIQICLILFDIENRKHPLNEVVYFFASLHLELIQKINRGLLFKDLSIDLKKELMKEIARSFIKFFDKKEKDILTYKQISFFDSTARKYYMSSLEHSMEANEIKFI